MYNGLACESVSMIAGACCIEHACLYIFVCVFVCARAQRPAVFELAVPVHMHTYCSIRSAHSDVTSIEVPRSA